MTLIFGNGAKLYIREGGDWVEVADVSAFECDLVGCVDVPQDRVERMREVWRMMRGGEQQVDPDGQYQTITEEGITLSPYTQEFTDWIQHCYELLEAGQEDRIMSDPFFDSGLSDELVDEILVALDKEFEYELGTYPGYHRNRSGANALPEFGRMSTRARRAMLEGCLRIKQKYAGANASTTAVMGNGMDDA